MDGVQVMETEAESAAEAEAVTEPEPAPTKPEPMVYSITLKELIRRRDEKLKLMFGQK